MPRVRHRYLVEQYCSECGRCCRRVGVGGLCPTCDEPVDGGPLADHPDSESVRLVAGRQQRKTPPILAPFVRLEDDWYRCIACADVFWGVANTTAVVLANAQRHAGKAHGAQAGARPQRRGSATHAK